MVCFRSMSEIEMLRNIKESKKMDSSKILENHMLYNLIRTFCYSVNNISSIEYESKIE